MRAVTVDQGVVRPDDQVLLWRGQAPLVRPGHPGEAAIGPAFDAGVAGFGPGVRIATARGYRRVEALQPGERVLTRDNGFAEVLDVRRQRAAAACVVDLLPGVIRGLAGAVTVGAGQGILWVGERVADALGTREGLLRACDLGAMAEAAEGFVTLFLPVLARHEVIFAEGMATESGLPAGAQRARPVMTQDQARRVLRA
jgi:hypothetical protein